MSQTINLPALGESVTEGTVTRWLVSVGDTVAVDQPIVEISTDKVDTEIPSPVAGVIEEILVPEDQEAEVGAPLVKIGNGTDTAQTRTEQTPAAPKKESESPPPTDSSAPPSSTSSAAPSSTPSGNGKEVMLPELGESVTEGTVTRWLVSVGDTVAVDQPIVEISTDKVDTEIPSPVAGIIQDIRAKEDETVNVGAPLAVVGGDAAASSNSSNSGRRRLAASPNPKEHPEEPKAETPAGDRRDSAPTDNSQGMAYITPLVRRLAAQHRVDLDKIQGTGVGGRVRKQDVLAAAGVGGGFDASHHAPPQAPTLRQTEQPPAAPAATPSGSPERRFDSKKASKRPPHPAPSGSPERRFDSKKASKRPPHPAPVANKLRGTTKKAPRIRQTIAKRMRESLRISAQLTQVIEVDMTKVAKLREEAKAKFQRREGVKLTFLPFFAKTVTEALKQHPKLNASYDEDSQEITYHEAEHLAIAVDTARGLLVPVINNAGELSLAGIAHKIVDIAERTRNGNIGPDELSGGTFTLTNFGSVGALFDTPIINQPQSAILGLGAIVKRPIVVSKNNEDTIAIRSMVYLSLTYDHRLIDGADAGRFLQTIKGRLEEGRFENEI